MAERTTPSVSHLFAQPVFFQTVTDCIPLGIAVYDAQRRIIHINRALEALIGMDRSEAGGINCAHIIRCNLCVEGCPAFDAGDAREGACVQGNIINRDRKEIPVRIHLSSIATSGGELVGFIETFEDLRYVLQTDAGDAQPYAYGGMIGRSPQMERVFQVLPVIARTDSPVLITGQTGTGKDMVAEAIHRASDRAREPLIKVCCGALPEPLLEAELFGQHGESSAGLPESRAGSFRLAHNGSLFLTEIGDLPQTLQGKLLAFLDSGMIYPAGSSSGVRVNVRLIAATHMDLEGLVKEGRFREDLYYRLNMVRMHLPPLAERGDDVRLLLDHFVHGCASERHLEVKGFSGEVLHRLVGYGYPGNVRELKNIVEYAANLCDEEFIRLEHLPAYLQQPIAVEEAQGAGSSALIDAALEGEAEDVRKHIDWSDMERKLIMEALLKAKGRRNKAADLLGWGRSTLWRKMKQYGLHR